jgi:hypothetical protein
MREDVGKGCRKVNIVEILCTHVYNGEIKPVETVPRQEVGR